MSRTVFISRTLYLKDDPSNKVLISLFVPEAEADERSFKCKFKITGGQEFEPVEFYGAGIDGLDALFNTIEMVKAHIDVINRKNYNGNLRWINDENLDLGLTSHWSK